MEKNKCWELTKPLANKENEGVLTEFFLHLKLGNRSEYTLISYRQFLQRFFVDMDEPISLLSSESILEWFKENDAHVKESTYRRHLDILSSLFNFCVNESIVPNSPIKKRWFPKLPKPVPKYLEKGDVAKVRQESERTSIRNQAIVEFMLSSGCRLSEVHSLNQEDVDLENRTVRVTGKGKKIRHVHFSEKCLVLLERYLGTVVQSASSPLFVTERTGTRLGKKMIQKIIQTIGVKAGLSTKLYPHRLRHTFATELLAKGADLSFISDELGHADLGTTQVYARIPNQQIVAQYRKYMG